MSSIELQFVSFGQVSRRGQSIFMEFDGEDYKKGIQGGQKTLRREENNMVLRVMRSINSASQFLN